jgi:hypothetical protein
MKRSTLASLLAGLAAALLLLAVPALSQQDMTTVPGDGFKTLTRPASRFAHDAHNEKAKIDDCTTCHHGEKDGKQDKTADSAGTPCADCHGKLGRTPLRRAFHKQCLGCHMEQNKGPVTCGDCHTPAK